MIGARAACAILLAVPVQAVGQAVPQFTDRSAALPVAHEYTGGWEHFVGGGVAIFDCNSDGFPDLYVAGGARPARLFVNATQAPGAPVDFLREVGEGPSAVTGAWPLDIDGDGITDLALARVGENRLLRGLGDCRFEEANEAWGFDGGAAWSTAFSATWEAGQTRPTLAFGNYVDRDDPEGPFGTCAPNELHRPEPGGWGVVALAPGFCALSILFSDRRHDGEVQLRLSNDRHYYLRDGREQMWRLDPLAELGPAEGWEQLSIWGMGIASRDLTGDGLPDVMLTSMGDQILQFATPDGGYAQAPFDRGAAAQRPFLGDDGRPSTGWHAEFGDIDNDGRDDLFIAKGNVDQMPSNALKDPNNLLMQGPDGRFSEAAEAAGVASVARSRGGGLADLNRDGLLDLVVVNRRAPVEVYQNATENAGGSVSVTLQDAAPNTAAIGSWIALRLPDGRVIQREVTSGGGHASGQLGAHHFGLGAAPGAEIRVTLPDGRDTGWQPVKAGDETVIDLTDD